MRDGDGRAWRDRSQPQFGHGVGRRPDMAYTIRFIGDVHGKYDRCGKTNNFCKMAIIYVGQASGFDCPEEFLRWNRSEPTLALAEIDALLGAPEGTAEGDRLDLLIAFVEAYEARRWPIDIADESDLGKPLTSS
jgi:hypothetical protein